MHGIAETGGERECGCDTIRVTGGPGCQMRKSCANSKCLIQDDNEMIDLIIQRERLGWKRCCTLHDGPAVVPSLALSLSCSGRRRQHRYTMCIPWVPLDHLAEIGRLARRWPRPFFVASSFPSLHLWPVQISLHLVAIVAGFGTVAEESIASTLPQHWPELPLLKRLTMASTPLSTSYPQ